MVAAVSDYSMPCGRRGQRFDDQCTFPEDHGRVVVGGKEWDHGDPGKSVGWDEILMTITYTTHETRTAVFDVTGLFRSNGWDPQSVASQHSPIDGPHGGKLVDFWVDVHAVRGRLPR